MRILKLLLPLTLFAGSHALATTSSVEYSTDADNGAIFPLSLDITSGDSDAAQYITATTSVGESVLSGITLETIDIDTDAFTWSYSRGAGTIPDACEDGYVAALGGCWSDGVLVEAASCSDDLVYDSGLCYEAACEDGFTAVGALCVGDFATDETAELILETAEEDQASTVLTKSLTSSSSSSDTIELDSDELPEIATTVVFSDAMCAFDSDLESLLEDLGLDSDSLTTFVDGLAEALGLDADTISELLSSLDLDSDTLTTLLESLGIDTSDLESLDTDSLTETIATLLGISSDTDLTDLLSSYITDAVNEAIADASTTLIESSTSWVTATLDSYVLFDLTTDITCEDDGTISSATLEVDPSMTVQLSTSIFDTVLSNLSGVDIGILNISIYELIPFRIYGTVGTTIDTPLVYYAEVDSSLPELYADDLQYATATSIQVTPSIDLWLSLDAYLRVTSLVDFIPDILQIGAEFYLSVLDEELDYLKTGGLQLSDDESSYEIYNTESLTSTLSSGSGYIDVYLKILGISLDVLDDADLEWDGYEQSDTLIDEESTTTVSL